MILPWRTYFSRGKSLAMLAVLPLSLQHGLSCSTCPDPVEPEQSMKLAPPPADALYHSSYPDFGGWEDEVSSKKILDFEELSKKKLLWAYASNNWWSKGKGIHFPRESIEAIAASGAIPFIRMMPRNEDPDSGDIALPDPVYSMQAFIDGQFDDALRKWALAAKEYQKPLLVEFGTEVNGDWFPWNARWNGETTKEQYGDPQRYDGMERFRDAYRHVIDIFRAEKVHNITWFFHLNLYDWPEKEWNQAQGYYPGDDYIDWIGISAYGAQEPEDELYPLGEMLDDRLPAIEAISSSGKPIALLEWGATEQEKAGAKAQWIRDAWALFEKGGRYHGKISALSYWHENFDETRLRIDSSPESLEAYQEGAASSTFIDEPRWRQDRALSLPAAKHNLLPSSAVLEDILF